MTELSGDHQGTWTVWGDSPKPIAQNLGKSEAANMVASLQGQGRTDVYAMDDVTGEELEAND